MVSPRGLKSKRFTLFGQLYDRYALEPAPVGDSLEPAVSTLILPVIDVADLYPPNIIEATLDLDVTVGTFISAATVPVNQRWHLEAINHESTNVANQILARDPADVVIRIGPGSQGHTLTNAIAGIILDEGWEIGASATDDVGDGARSFAFMFRREFLN